MIIIRKKQLINLVTIVTLCLIICVIQTSSVEDKSISTVALPVTNKVIVIDAGHGVPDEGDNSLK